MGPGRWVRYRVFLLLWALGGIFFFPRQEIRRGGSLYFTPPTMLRYFTFGYEEWVADWLWLRFLQDADFCSHKKGVPVYDGRRKSCDLGWSYHMVDGVTELAPRFLSAYKVSSVLMSVFTGDLAGAKRILLKGIRQFPHDGELHFYALYFYSVEEPDPSRAAYHALQAAENGGPGWLYSISDRTVDTHTLVKKSILEPLLHYDLSLDQRESVLKRLKNQAPGQKK